MSEKRTKSKAKLQQEEEFEKFTKTKLVRISRSPKKEPLLGYKRKKPEDNEPY